MAWPLAAMWPVRNPSGDSPGVGSGEPRETGAHAPADGLVREPARGHDRGSGVTNAISVRPPWCQDRGSDVVTAYPGKFMKAPDLDFRTVSGFFGGGFRRLYEQGWPKAAF